MNKAPAPFDLCSDRFGLVWMYTMMGGWERILDKRGEPVPTTQFEQGMPQFDPDEDPMKDEEDPRLYARMTRIEQKLDRILKALRSV